MMATVGVLERKRGRKELRQWLEEADADADAEGSAAIAIFHST